MHVCYIVTTSRCMCTSPDTLVHHSALVKTSRGTLTSLIDCRDWTFYPYTCLEKLPWETYTWLCAVFVWCFLRGRVWGRFDPYRSQHLISSDCGVSIMSKCVIFNIELLVLYSCKLMFAVLVSDCKNSLLKSLVIILALLYSMSNYIRSYMYP